MAVGIRFHRPAARLRLILASVLCAALGGLLGLGAATFGGYSWSGSETRSQQTTNLSPGEAERIAREYAEQQFRLVQQAHLPEKAIAPPRAARRAAPSQLQSEATPLVTVDSQFLTGAGPAEGASKLTGAWLFVFRVEGFAVEEWRTQDAVLEIHVVLSDASGRMLQAGVLLLPKEQAKAAALP